MNRKRIRYDTRRQRGAAAIIAMMYLVIFSSLGAAMAIVAQSNFMTADTHLKAQRAMAAAETGMGFVIYHLNEVTANIKTRDGIIDSDNAQALWAATRGALVVELANNLHNLAEPVLVYGGLTIGPIAVGPDDPTFTATFDAHPLTGEDYDTAYYQRPPFDSMDPPVSAASPLDLTWVRVRVASSDGPVQRSIQLDFKMDKKIPFAILSKKSCHGRSSCHDPGRDRQPLHRNKPGERPSHSDAKRLCRA
jgi:hypothetical protein